VGGQVSDEADEIVAGHTCAKADALLTTMIVGELTSYVSYCALCLWK